MEMLCASGVTPIVRDPVAGQRFYRDVLGLPSLTNAQNPNDVAMNDFGGVKHFGVSALADAAQSCFGVAAARLLGPEGLLTGLSFAPWMH